jgi:hypothetical protein
MDPAPMFDRAFCMDPTPPLWRSPTRFLFSGQLETSSSVGVYAIRR